MKAFNNFDGVRLVAALAVLISHQFWIAGAAEPHTFGPMTLGSLAVLVFFAISGHLVASSWVADPVPWRFAARRFLRIWPAYFVAIGGAALWVGFTDSRPLAQTAAWMFVFKHLQFARFEWDFFPAFHDPRLNPSIWTIPFEAGCYVAFAVVAILARKWWAMTLATVGGVAFAAWGVGMRVFDPSDVSAGTDCVFFGALFAFGAVLLGLPALRTAKASAALGLVGAVAYLTGSEVIGLVLVIPTVAVFVGASSWPVFRQVARFGDLSYGIYLWGWPVQQIVASRMGVDVGIWRLLAVSLPLVVVLAMISWHLVEKRALRVKPSTSTQWPRWARLELR